MNLSELSSGDNQKVIPVPAIKCMRPILTVSGRFYTRRAQFPLYRSSMLPYASLDSGHDRTGENPLPRLVYALDSSPHPGMACPLETCAAVMV